MFNTVSKSTMDKYYQMKVADLKKEAKTLKVSGYSTMKKSELIDSILKKINADNKGLTRLEYTRPNKKGETQKNLKKTETNEKILNMKSNSFNVNEINEKLMNYTEVPASDVKPGNKTWYRYFVYNPDTRKYDFKTGGFVLTNKPSDNFVSLFNQSLKFSFSVPKQVSGKPTIFFKSRSKKEITGSLNDFLKTYFDNSKKFLRTDGYIVLDPKENKLTYHQSIADASAHTEGSDIGIRLTFKEKRPNFKKFFITRGTRSDFGKIEGLLGEIDTELETVDNIDRVKSLIM